MEDSYKIHFIEDHNQNSFYKEHKISPILYTHKKLLSKLVKYNQGNPLLNIIENRQILKSLDQIEYDFSKNE